jgi:hypothetical protein
MLAAVKREVTMTPSTSETVAVTVAAISELVSRPTWHSAPIRLDWSGVLRSSADKKMFLRSCLLSRATMRSLSDVPLTVGDWSEFVLGAWMADGNLSGTKL